MNILYLSCHGILEYDEVKILTMLGHNVFCIGDINGNERPHIPGRSLSSNWLTKQECDLLFKNGQGNIPDSILEKTDVIISMHISSWLKDQWNKIKNKKVFLRLIGQHDPGLGRIIQPMTNEGLKAIPYWSSDLELNGLKEDQVTNVTRFYKDESEFCNWIGNREIVLTACNDIERGDGQACHAEEYKFATHGLNRLLIGKNNRCFGDFTARVPYWMLKDLYRESKLYFYVGTRPATYTLNMIEAMMTGMPIVSLDSGIARELFKFVSNDPYELNDILKDLMKEDVSELKKYSMRDKCIELFGIDQAKKSWSELLC